MPFPLSTARSETEEKVVAPLLSPCRRARAPEGERAAVKRHNGGALSRRPRGRPLISKEPMVPTVHFWESIDHHVRLFHNVRVVVMRNFTGSAAELAFLKLIIEDAPVLRKAEIKDKGRLGKYDLKNLLKMRRASKDAEIVVL